MAALKENVSNLIQALKQEILTLRAERDKAIDAWDKASDEREELRAELEKAQKERS